MEFRDLKKQYQVLKPIIDKAVISVMSKCNFISGNQVKELEVSLAEYVGIKHCVTCGNGTDALTLAMMAYNIGFGDAVFVPDFTFFASAETIAVTGAIPIFVDVDVNTYNIDAESLKRAIKRVKEEGKLCARAVVAVDLFGLPADFPEIKKIAKEEGLIVIEDGAQGFGGKIENQVACSFGDIATTSFFPAKPLGCYGDGGAIFTNDDDIAALIRSICVHGKGTSKYDNVRLGVNSRLDTIQAAILQVKLDAFKEYELVDVNKAASWYTERLKNVVKIPVVQEGYYSSWAQYTIQLKDREQRDKVQTALKEKDIPTMIYYSKLMHEQGAFSNITFDFDCPVSDHLRSVVLQLPIYPYLTEKEVELVCNTIIENLE